jgi:hypothetical protein
VPAVVAALVGVLLAVTGGSAVAWRVAAVLTLVLAATLSRSPVVPAVGLTALLAVDLAAATGPFGSLRSLPTQWSQSHHVHGYEVLEPSRFAALRDEMELDRLAFVAPRSILANVNPFLGAPPVHDAFQLSCYEALMPGEWAQMHREVGGLPTRGLVLGDVDPDQFPLVCDLASVKHIITVDVQPDSQFASVKTRRFRSGRGRATNRPVSLRVQHIANEDALPRAYLLDRFVVERPADTIARVADGSLALRSAVSLERDPGFVSGSGPAAPIPAVIRFYAPEKVVIEAEAPGESLLVLTDSFYPGWRASVDGVETEILRANAVHRAVRLPAGSHRVIFEYAPASVRWGGAISALALGAVGLAPFVARRLREARPGKTR